jgi:DNA repair protein RadC
MVVSKKKKKISSPEDVKNIMVAILNCEDEIERDKEHFWTIGLNTKNVIKYIDLISLGTATESIVHPRETFRRAIIGGVSSVMIIHNHPSGEITPSKDDIKTTNRLVEAGKIIGIGLMDHIIITQDGDFISFKEDGYI